MRSAENRSESVRAFMRALAQMARSERSAFVIAYQTHVAAAGSASVSPAQFARGWVTADNERRRGPVVLRPIEQLPDTYATQLDGLASALEHWHTDHELPPVHLDTAGAVRSGHASIAAARLLELDLVPTITDEEEGALI